MKTKAQKWLILLVLPVFFLACGGNEKDSDGSDENEELIDDNNECQTHCGYFIDGECREWGVICPSGDYAKSCSDCFVQKDDDEEEGGGGDGERDENKDTGEEGSRYECRNSKECLLGLINQVYHNRSCSAGGCNTLFTVTDTGKEHGCGDQLFLSAGSGGLDWSEFCLHPETLELSYNGKFLGQVYLGCNSFKEGYQTCNCKVDEDLYYVSCQPCPPETYNWCTSRRIESNCQYYPDGFCWGSVLISFCSKEGNYTYEIFKKLEGPKPGCRDATGDSEDAARYDRGAEW